MDAEHSSCALLHRIMTFRDMQPFEFTQRMKQRSLGTMPQSPRHLRHAFSQALSKNVALAQASPVSGILNQDIQFRFDPNLHPQIFRVFEMLNARGVLPKSIILTC
jgi:hypothetical protein